MAVKFDKQDLAMKLNMIDGLIGSVKIQNLEWAEGVVNSHNGLTSKISSLRERLQKAQATAREAEQNASTLERKAMGYKPKKSVSQHELVAYGELKDADDLSRLHDKPALAENFAVHLNQYIKLLNAGIRGTSHYKIPGVDRSGLLVAAHASDDILSDYTLVYPKIDDAIGAYFSKLQIYPTCQKVNTFDAKFFLSQVKNMMVRALQDFTKDDIGHLSKDEQYEFLQSVQKLRTIVRGQNVEYHKSIRGTVLENQHPLCNLLLLSLMRVLPVFNDSPAVKLNRSYRYKKASNVQASKVNEVVSNSYQLQVYTDKIAFSGNVAAYTGNGSLEIAKLLANPSEAASKWSKFNDYDGEKPMFDLGPGFRDNYSKLMRSLGELLAVMASNGFVDYKHTDESLSPYLYDLTDERVTSSNLQRLW